MTNETIDAHDLSNENKEIENQDSQDEIQEPIVEEEDSEPKQEEEPRELELDELPLPGDEKDIKKSDLPKWAEKRLSKKDREISEAKAQAETLRLENERLMNLSANQNIQSGNDERPPQRDDYDNEDDFIDARIDFRNKQNFSKLNVLKQLHAQKEKEENFLKSWKSSEETGLKKYEDFDEKFEVLNSPLIPANRMMAEAIIDSPFKDDILYFLGSNPEHARKLASLGGIQATKKIAEIESRFAARKKATSSTKAPAILSPVKSNKSAPAKVNPEQIPQEDFDRWYKEKYGRR